MARVEERAPTYLGRAPARSKARRVRYPQPEKPKEVQTSREKSTTLGLVTTNADTLIGCIAPLETKGAAPAQKARLVMTLRGGLGTEGGGSYIAPRSHA
jgi:hypothetical protein